MSGGSSGFLFGLAFGAGGTVREIAGFADAAPRAGEHLRWLHLDWRADAARAWLRAQAGVDPVAAAAALGGTVRPRVSHFGDVLLLVLRAARHESAGGREGLGSLRLLAAPDCLVTLRRSRIRAVERVGELARQRPQSFRRAADLIVELAAGIQDRLQELIEGHGESLDDLEDRIADPAQSPERAEVVDLRRSLIALRKSLVPQREALVRLAAEPHPRLAREHEKLLREEAQRAARLVDEVESARERTAVLMEELAVQSTEQLNRRIYYFTVIAGIFLPLTFLAGALGMNVGGIPLADHPWGFAAALAVMSSLGVGIWLLLRRKRWV